MLKRVFYVPVMVGWLLVLLLVLWGVGVAFGYTNMPWQRVSAQTVEECDGECPVQQTDVCWNLDGVQESVPQGYHIDQTQDNSCVADPAPQVLGASTSTPSASDTAPQVLAATTVQGK